VYRFSRHLAIAAAAAALLATATAARADGVPGLRGHDHTGITVPDMKQATDFFVGVLGCKEAMAFGPFADEKGDFMSQLVNVNPRAVINKIVLLRCGYGSNIELFQYTSPDQKNMTPKNSDVGGYHIAFYVDDIKAAKEYLDGKGVKTFFNLPVDQGRRPVRASSISSRLGVCKWKPSAIRTAWPTRRPRRSSCGRRRIRRSNIVKLAPRDRLKLSRGFFGPKARAWSPLTLPCGTTLALVAGPSIQSYDPGT
jgi:catechol 2,3-dioxygenase-like lactoylglutathione lyase family enzyme